MAARAELGMGFPDGVRLSKGATRLVQQANVLGVNTQRYLGELTEAKPGKVCVKGLLAGLKEEVMRAKAKQGEMRGR